MVSRNLVIVGLLVILIVVGGWFYVVSQNLEKSPQETPPPAQQVFPTPAPPLPPPSKTASPSAQAIDEKVVAATDKGFVPKTVKVKAGESVTFMNTGIKNHQVNSNPHPAHDDFPILNEVGLLKSKDQKRIEFKKKGAYTFHDHLNPSFTGSIIVQ
jgi:plastocyanin